MKEFKSKKVLKEAVKIDDNIIELEINLNSGNILKIIELAQKSEKTGDVKNFIEIAHMLFGKGYEHIEFLELSDFYNYMSYIVEKYIIPEKEKIDQGKDFNPESYKGKKFEIE